jgi:hypothetical protein
MRTGLLLAFLLLTACSGAAGDACASREDCDDGFACVDGVCVERPDAGVRDAGTCTDCECVTAADCPAVAPCAENVCEEGRCRAIENDAVCAPVGVCDAREGCVAPPEDAGLDAAVPDGSAPRSDAGPVDAGPRDAGGGAVDAGALVRSSVGAACTREEECPMELGFARRCVDSAEGVAFPDGYCTERCFGPGGCDDGSVCWDGGGFLSRFCLRRCRSERDCRTGYVCGTPSEGTLAGAGPVCIPPGL